MTFQEKATIAFTSYKGLRKMLIDEEFIQELFLKTTFMDGPIRQRLWHVVNNNYDMPLCGCGASVRWNVKNSSYRQFCSSKCAHNSPIVREKIEKTCEEKYGTKSFIMTDSFKSGYRQKMMKKYGVENPFQSKVVQETIKKKVKKKYGVNNISQHPEVRKKITETHRQRYGRDRASQTHIPDHVCELKKDRNYLVSLYERGMSILDISKMLGVGHSQLCLRFQELGIEIHQSSGQIELFNHIKEHILDDVLMNAKPFNGSKQEVDIYIPVLRVGFEYDGIYWHSEASSGKKLYHYEKDKQAALEGIKIYHITDVEWKKKKDICVSRVNSILGKNKKIYARKTEIKEVGHGDAMQFLDANHIQGAAASSINLGLYDQDNQNTLVALMTFGKSRYNSYQYELIRYCSALNTNVVGGASKLFSRAKNMIGFETVVSFCDLRWGTGSMYEQLGFKRVRHNGPSYLYTNGYLTLENRLTYQKHRLSGILTDFDSTLSEWENMQNHGYDRYWNSGTDVWLWCN